jgi:hypothetical protein
MYLRKPIYFLGLVELVGQTEETFVALLEDLRVVILLPSGNDLSFEHMKVSGRWKEWDIVVEGQPVTYRHGHDSYSQLGEKYGANFIECPLINANKDKLWSEFTITLPTCRIIKTDMAEVIPEEFGMLLSPAEHRLRRILPTKFISYRGLPSFMADVDKCYYVENFERWGLDILVDRVGLLCGAASIINGDILTCQYVVGRNNNNVFCLLFHDLGGRKYLANHDNYQVFLMADPESLSKFSDHIFKHIESISHSNRRQYLEIAVGYYGALHSLYYSEPKVAFCYQICESLANIYGKPLRQNYKRALINRLTKKHKKRLCANCSQILQRECYPEPTNEFIGEIVSALSVINVNSNYEIANSLLEYCMHYRNEVFHGDLIKTKERICKLRDEVESFYGNPILLVCKSLVVLLGAHVLLGIEYDDMKIYYSWLN